MTQTLTGAVAKVGGLIAKGDITSASGALSASADFGFSSSSVAICIKRLPISDLTAGEHDTGFDLPIGSVVRNAYLDVNTRELTGSTKTVSVGLLSSETGGTATGLLFGVSTASVQSVTGSLISTGRTFGSLLTVDSSGSGSFVRNEHSVRTGRAVSVSYILGSAHTELAADIILEYLKIG